MRFRPGARLDAGQVQDQRGSRGSRHRGGRRRRGNPHRRRAGAARRRTSPAAAARIRSRSAPAGLRRLRGQLSSDLPHRKRRQPARGLPDRRRRQLRAGLLGRPACAATARRRRASSAARRRPAAAARPRPSGRSTAPPTRRSTSISASTTSCARASARSGGPFAEAYVIAHEYGHHVQHLLGTDEQRRRRPPGREVRLRAARAPGRLLRRRLGRPRRRDRLHRGPHRRDIADGLDAAAAVGDDRIQQRATGRVDRGELDPRLLRRSARSGSTPAIAPATRPVRHLRGERALTPAGWQGLPRDRLTSTNSYYPDS